MKAMIRPTCARCGYTYDPNKEMRVLVFRNNEGEYAACERCIAELGRMKEAYDPEVRLIDYIESFKAEEE